MRFPLFVDIENKKVLVVGAGKVGLRRAEVLGKFGADIILVSDFVRGNIPEGIRLVKRPFEDGDIEGCFMVVAAADKRAVNKRIGELCRQRGIFVSVADSREESTFYFPAICMGENICVGLVSDGKHHDLARNTAEKIREAIK